MRKEEEKEEDEEEVETESTEGDAVDEDERDLPSVSSVASAGSTPPSLPSSAHVSSQEFLPLGRLRHAHQNLTHSLHELHLIDHEISERLSQTEHDWRERENTVSSREQYVQRYVDLDSWQRRLSLEQAQLFSERSTFQETAMRQVQECLRRITQWEEQHRLPSTSSSYQNPLPNS